MTLIINNYLRRQLEGFLNNWPTEEEYGGFLIQNWRSGRVTNFLPVPNWSQKPKEEFNPHDREKVKRLAEKLGNPVAFWHSHPTPCIMSAGDLSYASFYKDLIFVTISPLNHRWSKQYIWYACKGVEPVEVEFIGP